MTSGLREIDSIQTEAVRISELARSCDLSTPMPHLGRWKIRDLIAHLGGVHRWATQIVQARSMGGPSFTKSKLDGAELGDWFDDGAKALVDELRSHDPSEECPNFNPGSVTNVAWWIRRQLHETTVHRWDLEHTLGDITPIDNVLAADGVDEFLDVFVRTRGKQTLTAPLVLSTTDPKQAWTLTPAEKPGRIDTTTGSDDGVEAALNGSAANMLLFLWGRLSIAEAELAVSGDETVAASFLRID